MTSFRHLFLSSFSLCLFFHFFVFFPLHVTVSFFYRDVRRRVFFLSISTDPILSMQYEHDDGLIAPPHGPCWRRTFLVQVIPFGKCTHHGLRIKQRHIFKWESQIEPTNQNEFQMCKALENEVCSCMIRKKRHNEVKAAKVVMRSNENERDYLLMVNGTRRVTSSARQFYQKKKTCRK